ncbi:MAG: alpha/beta hydrolase [Proteobacteria bacterium]|nr:alpha/beta hydrolase [Pseudomonadota bacterium]
MISTSEIDDRIRTEFVEANHLRFEVDMCGEGDRLALCLHGFPEHSISWRHQLPMLAELGYKVWAPNMRGYGNSSVPMFMEDYALEKLMADVAALIDAAGCDEVVLIAHDWGAVIAWYFAMRQIRPLNKLIICNVPHPVPAQKAFRRFAQLKKSWYIFFFQLPGVPEMLMRMRRGRGMGDLIKRSASNPENFPDEVIDLYNQNGSRPENLTAMINYYRALVRGGGGKRQRDLGYPIIDTPTLMLWGEDDMALTRETTVGTDQVVRDFTIRYLPRISHWVQQDAPREVNAMMRAFLTDQPVPEMRWEAKLVLPEIS